MPGWSPICFTTDRLSISWFDKYRQFDNIVNNGWETRYRSLRTSIRFFDKIYLLFGYRFLNDFDNKRTCCMFIIKSTDNRKFLSVASFIFIRDKIEWFARMKRSNRVLYIYIYRSNANSISLKNPLLKSILSPFTRKLNMLVAQFGYFSTR